MKEFTHYHCDSNDPVGYLCNELYDCILKERGRNAQGSHDENEEEKQEKEKKNDSWMEEICVAIIVSAISSYFAGLNNMRRLLHFLLVVSSRATQALLRKFHQKMIWSRALLFAIYVFAFFV